MSKKHVWTIPSTNVIFIKKHFRPLGFKFFQQVAMVWGSLKFLLAVNLCGSELDSRVARGGGLTWEE